MQRIVTGGEGGVANVHVARVKSLPPFFHTGYDEVYYVVSGTGTVTLDGEISPLRPGSVVVIPAGVTHAAGCRGRGIRVCDFRHPAHPDNR